MAEESKQGNTGGNELSSLGDLSSLSLGPDWGSGDVPKTKAPKIREDRSRSGGDRPHDRRRRPDSRGEGRRDSQSGEGKSGPGGGRPDRRGSMGARNQTRRGDSPDGPGGFFEPVVHVDFYPEEEPFKVLSQAVRTSLRTYELFEIARLILEKPDRWVCVVKDPQQKEGEPARLVASVPDGLPFQSEEAALSHVFLHYLDRFFRLEEIEVDPPKGSFQVIHKCGITGELLGPPNFHRYQALCRSHHSRRLAHLPYGRFESKIESVKDEEGVQAWLELMKKQTRYHSVEDEGTYFDTLEDARLYLLTKSKDKLIRPAYSARFSGKDIALLDPGDPIRRSVEEFHSRQVRFPLDTANHIRGRLRRMNFTVFKKGSKGVSYVSGVKRRFRKPGEVLADNLQELIDFIEAHPNFPRRDLVKSFLGIEPPKDPGETPSPATAAPDYSEKDKEAILNLKRDLRYLLSEGYVTEFSDGRLFVPPIREEDIREKEKETVAQSAEKTIPDGQTPAGEPSQTESKPAEDGAPKAILEAQPTADPSTAEEPMSPDTEAKARPESTEEPPEEVAPSGEDSTPTAETPPAEEADPISTSSYAEPQDTGPKEKF